MDREFLNKTTEFWRPHYQEKLTQENAQQIIENITALFNLLGKWAQEEKNNEIKEPVKDKNNY